METRVQKIVPHLWYDKEAGEDGELYTSLFADSSILGRSTIGDTPSGTVEILTIQLAGQRGNGQGCPGLPQDEEIRHCRSDARL